MAQFELLTHSDEPETLRKSDGAYRTISEVSEELDVPQHVLRFWEMQFPQVKPSRMRGSRRYYRPEDIDVLRRIKALLYQQGYTIKGAKKIVKSGESVAQPVQEQLEASFAPPARAERPEIKRLIGELRNLRTLLDNEGIVSPARA